MQNCPGCGYLLPAAWTTCQRCGGPAPAPANADAPQPEQVAAASRYAVPVTTPAYPSPLGELPPPGTPIAQPVPYGSTIDQPAYEAPYPTPSSQSYEPFVRRGVDAPEPANTGNPRKSLFIGIGVALLVLGAVLYAFHSGGGGHKSSPEILPPQGPTQGLPTSLQAAERIQAESSRHTAMQGVMNIAASEGGAVTVEAVAAANPNFEWVGGTTDSKPGVISFGYDRGVSTIAVGAKDGMCAFGRWTPPAPPQYVTMANVKHCQASAAPAEGWSMEAGGSAGDLPDENP